MLGANNKIIRGATRIRRRKRPLSRTNIRYADNGRPPSKPTCYTLSVRPRKSIRPKPRTALAPNGGSLQRKYKSYYSPS